MAKTKIRHNKALEWGPLAHHGIFKNENGKEGEIRF